MPARLPVNIELQVDGVRVESETSCSWAGAHVLTLHTVIPRADVAFELHSTFVGHPRLPTHVVHLRLGPPGCEPSITYDDVDDPQTGPTYAPRSCAYEHAQRLIEVLSELGHRAAVNVSGEGAFEALERLGPESR